MHDSQAGLLEVETPIQIVPFAHGHSSCVSCGFRSSDEEDGFGVWRVANFGDDWPIFRS